ncbi:MAG: amidohydrolase family protein [Caldisericaceae bacterium]|nr:amidohydrolase family protein [Caldisericaceae bacterium]
MKTIFSADSIYINKIEKKDYSVVVENGIIQVIGKRNLIKQQFPFVREKKYDGFLYPGFNDAHVHIKEIALLLSSENATNCKSYQCVKRLIEGNDKNFVYIYNLDFNNFSRNEWEKLFEYNKKPVFIQSKDEHSVFVNKAALKEKQIALKRIRGGVLVKNKGKFIGILKDRAIELVKSIKERQISIKDVKNAEKYLLKRGIVSATNFDFSIYPLLNNINKNKDLKIRIYQGIEKNSLEDVINEKIHTGLGDKNLRFGPLKCFMDGSLGSQTAAMYRVNGFPSSFTMEKDELNNIISLANETDIQVAVHAIGDKAVHTVMSLFSRFGNQKMRNRIEHLQFINEKDLSLLQRTHCIASMQPIHATADAALVKKLIGNYRYAYPWKTVLNSGKLLAFGSDAPVEDASPLQGIYAATTRISPNSTNPFVPEECISRKEAFDAYTTGSAFASFAENVSGKIKNGYLADFILLDKSLFHFNDIMNIIIIKNIIGGIEWMKSQ